MSIPESALAEWIAAHAGIHGVRVERELSGGNANLTLQLATDDGAVVLRTPPESAISPKAHRGIERESKVLRALQGRVRVPEVLAWCEDVDVIGRPFLLVSHVDGVSITEELPADYPDTADSVNSLGEQLVDELAAIHQVPWQDAGLADFGNPDNFLARQIGRWRDIRAQASVRELPLMDGLGQWLADNLPTPMEPTVVHGDYHLDNTLCRRDKPELAAVIDWELATIGDPLTDLGLLLMFWGPRKISPPGFPHVQRVTRRDGVLSRRELAERWSAATGHSLADIDYYFCFAFWRLAAIVEGAYQLYVEGTVATDYARGLEHTVPALLAEAEAAASGDW
ncbi:MAG: phosphotransferase family protein [Halieaceae bacterium]|nr:phosphotransferase family protein [Halieaceae bacterium]